jgi:hypothetical protein
MRILRSVVGVIAVSTALTCSFATAAQAAEVDLHARLSGSSAFSTATGSSDYERGSGGREVEVTVRNIAGLAGKRVGVFVAGAKVGTMRVRSTGVAHREWDTEHGDAVPFASAGDRVKVKTASGTLIASGTFARVAGD